MAKNNIGTIYAELAVKDRMTVGLKRATGAVRKFGGELAGYAKYAVGAVAAGMVIGTKRSLDMVDALGDMSKQTGIAVSDLMVLQRAYKDGGSDAEAAGKDIARMQKSIAGALGGDKDPFKSLGLSAQALIALSPAEQFEAIGKAIMEIENPTLRNAKAMEIFGKSGSRMMTVFGTLDKAKESLGQMPDLAEKFAERFGEANDLIGHLPDKLDAFFIGFTSGIVDELLPALREIDKMEFAGLGRAVGEGAKDVGGAVNDVTNSLIDYIPLFKTLEILGRHAGMKNQGASTPWGALSETLMGPGPGGKTADDGRAAKAQAILDAAQEAADEIDAKRKTRAADTSPLEDEAENIQKAMDAISDYEHELEKLDAIEEGNEERYKQLEKEQAIREKIADLIDQGIDKDEAYRMAQAWSMQQTGADDAKAAREQASKDELDRLSAWESTRIGVNEMQARGLGMGSEKIPDELNKQVDLLEQIRDEIKRKKENEATF